MQIQENVHKLTLVSCVWSENWRFKLLNNLEGRRGREGERGGKRGGGRMIKKGTEVGGGGTGRRGGGGGETLMLTSISGRPYWKTKNCIYSKRPLHPFPPPFTASAPKSA